MTRIKLVKTFLFWLGMVILLKEINPDLVHGQGIEMGCPALLSKMLFKKPYVLWSRQSIKLFSDNLPSKLRSLLLYLVSAALSNANGVIALTNAMKNEIISICDRDIVVIPNGIDHLHNGLRSSKQGNIEKHILCVSVFRREKGLKYLLEAMQIIIKNRKNIILDIIGYGPEEHLIKSEITNMQIGDYVVLHGRQPHEKISQYMLSSDVFVLPSLSEGFPNVILEAMDCGLPIVATNVGGLPEIIQEGTNGFIVDPGKPELLAENILKILEDDCIRRAMITNNLRDVKKYYWKNVIETIESFYELIIND